MTPKQKKYNVLHSKTRVFIEHSFGVLKGRLKILSYINVCSIKRATQIIIACCVLHNLCLANNDLFSVDLELCRVIDDGPYLPDYEDEGITKRNEIADVL